MYIVKLVTRAYSSGDENTEMCVCDTAEEISECLINFMDENYDIYFSDFEQYDNKENIEDFDDEIWKLGNRDDLYDCLSVEAVESYLSDPSLDNVIFGPYNSYDELVPFELSIHPVPKWSDRKKIKSKD